MRQVSEDLPSLADLDEALIAEDDDPLDEGLRALLDEAISTHNDSQEETS